MVRLIARSFGLLVGLLLAFATAWAVADTPPSSKLQPSQVQPLPAVTEIPRAPSAVAEQEEAQLDADDDALDRALDRALNSLDLEEFDSEPTRSTPELEIETIKQRYPDGSTNIERQVTQDAAGNYLNHGMWQMWDEKGNLQAIGHYAHGQRDGKWQRMYRNPREAKLLSKMPYQQFTPPFISQASFKNGQLDGSWIIVDSKKRKVSQWHFAKGHRHGTSTWWFANGRKMREIEYRNGDMDGLLLEWDQEGTQITEERFQAGRKLDTKTERYADGSRKTEGVYLFAKTVEETPDDWWNCTLQTFSRKGPDEKHGLWTAWHPNGKQQAQGLYEHDTQVGQFSWWHSNGQKSLDGQFRDGKQDGPWAWFHANGQKAIVGQYDMGTPTGRWTWWKEDGKIAQTADLTKAEGVVIETPQPLEAKPHTTATKIPPRSSARR